MMFYVHQQRRKLGEVNLTNSFSIVALVYVKVEISVNSTKISEFIRRFNQSGCVVSWLSISFLVVWMGLLIHGE